MITMSTDLQLTTRAIRSFRSLLVAVTLSSGRLTM